MLPTDDAFNSAPRAFFSSNYHVSLGKQEKERISGKSVAMASTYRAQYHSLPATGDRRSLLMLPSNGSRPSFHEKEGTEDVRACYDLRIWLASRCYATLLARHKSSPFQPVIENYTINPRMFPNVPVSGKASNALKPPRKEIYRDVAYTGLVGLMVMPRPETCRYDVTIRDTICRNLGRKRGLSSRGG